MHSDDRTRADSTPERARQGAWLEAITLFQAVREGNQPAAKQLLETSADRDRVIGNLLSMLGVFLRGEDADKLDRFIAASHRAGPPPAFGSRPSLRPLD